MRDQINGCEIKWRLHERKNEKWVKNGDSPLLGKGRNPSLEIAFQGKDTDL